MAKKQKQSSVESFELKRVFFLSLIMLLILPILVIAVVFGFSSNLLPRASEPDSIRVWLEPSTVITRADQPVVLTVMAAVEGENILIPSIQATIAADESTTITPSVVSYPKPLKGKTSLGTITLRSTTPGVHLVTVPEDLIHVSGQHVPTFSVQGATINVK